MPKWWTDVMGDITVAQVIVGFLVVVGLVLLLAKLWPSLRALVRIAEMIETLTGLMDTLKATPAFQHRTEATLETLRQQVENTHDTNLRDELTDVLDVSKTTAETVSSLHTRVENVEDVLDKVNNRLDKDHRRIAALEQTAPRERNNPHE